jgi:hypothetical protein
LTKGGLLLKKIPRSLVLQAFGAGFYCILSFTGQQYYKNINEKHGKVWKSIEKYGKASKSMEKHRKVWKSMEKHGKASKSMEKYGKASKSIFIIIWFCIFVTHF